MENRNELTNRRQMPLVNPESTEINFNDSVEGFVAHADTVNNRYQQFFVGQMMEDPELAEDGEEPQQTLFNREYYNLFVCAALEKIGLGYDHFLVTKDRTLTEGYTKQEIVDRFRGFSKETKQRIMSYPAIICNENPATRHADKKQVAYLSKITRINIQENGAMIYYAPIMRISQQRLNNWQMELGISTRDYFDEMMHTHWAIKQIDLFQVLADSGLRIY